MVADMRRTLSVVGIACTAGLWWSVSLSTPASAAIEGPCTASFAGTDVTAGHDAAGTAIHVLANDTVAISGTSSGVVADITYAARILGGEVNFGDVGVSGDGRSWAGTVDLSKFTWATVGLYEVTAHAQTSAGGCVGRAYVCIEGRSPLATAAGGGAAAVALGGSLALALSLARAGRAGSGGSVVVGFVGGAAAALGVSVLLQQYCVAPLTTLSGAAVPVAVGAIGSAASLSLRRKSRGVTRAHKVAPSMDAITPTPTADPTHATKVAPGSGAGTPAQTTPAPAGPSGGTAVPVQGSAAAGGPTPTPPTGGGPAGGVSPSPTAVEAETGAASASPPTPSVPASTPPGSPAGAVVPSTGVPIPPAPPKAEDRVGCPSCGAVNPSENRFCTRCGTPLSS